MTSKNSFNTYAVVGGLIFGAGLTCGYKIASLMKKIKPFTGTKF